jgi:hypothetical protein
VSSPSNQPRSFAISRAVSAPGMSEIENSLNSSMDITTRNPNAADRLAGLGIHPFGSNNFKIFVYQFFGRAFLTRQVSNKKQFGRFDSHVCRFEKPTKP